MGQDPQRPVWERIRELARDYRGQLRDDLDALADDLEDKDRRRAEARRKRLAALEIEALSTLIRLP